jgi:hypothetical protein
MWETEVGNFRLSSNEQHQLRAALKAWVDHHPEPDKPAISVANAGQFSPRQIYNEVVEESEFGEFFIRLVEHGVKTVCFTDILAGFSRSA